jgi:hypothetical protein
MQEIPVEMKPKKQDGIPLENIVAPIIIVAVLSLLVFLALRLFR